MSKKKKSTRDEIRSKMFSGNEFKKEEINLFGADVEIRQPSLGAMLEFQQNDDRKEAMFQVLLGYCYIPGTDEKVFEAGDKDSILAMPFGPDIVELNKAIEKLTDIDVSGAEGN